MPIQFSNGNQIVHMYDAMGNRLRTTYYTRKVALVEPATNTIPGTDNLQEYNIAYGKIFQSRSFNPRQINPNVICEEMFYVHNDHLGSASWITNEYGEPVQYLHYAPYGELIANQRMTGYDERFKYIGKERDWESGYDNFGARYYCSDLDFWTRVDPLVDKNISTSPYMYCGGNPLKYIDLDGRDWYEAEDGSAVLWKNGNEQTIQVNNVSYKNIGENYSHIIGNAEYSYHQSDLLTISYSTNTAFYSQGQDKTGCKRTCDKMVTSAGATPMTGRNGEILMATHDENGVVTNATRNYQQGLYRLEDYLSNGIPCIIGVDYKSKQAHNLAPSGDGMTDHFVTIVGMTINVRNGSTYYNFYDPGSTVRGASSNNIISVIGSFLQGRTAAFGNPFRVTTIRKNKF